MQSHSGLFPSSFSRFFVFTIFLLIIPVVYINSSQVRFSSAQVTNKQYTNCGRPFQCGTISASYPFWGQDRPSYCGEQGFQLNCTDNNTASIEISSQRYRVITINNETQVLNIAPQNAILKGSCPEQISNSRLTFIPSSLLFQLTSATQNLTLFSNCLASGLASLSSETYFQYNCSSYSSPTNKAGLPSFYIFENVTKGAVFCTGNRIDVPVLQTAVTEFWRTSNQQASGVGGVIIKGFQVGWNTDGPPCRGCIESGGQCGYNSTSSTSICFCSNGPYQTRCYSPTGTGDEV